MVEQNGTKRIVYWVAACLLFGLVTFLFGQIILQMSQISDLKINIAVVQNQNSTLTIKIDELNLEIKELKILISQHDIDTVEKLK